MKKEPQHKRHPSSQIGELAATAVHNAQQRRGRVLAAAELESATGGALSEFVVDWRIDGRILQKLQNDSLSVTPATAGLEVTAAKFAR